MVKPKCVGVTKNDKPCKNPSREGSEYCAVHEPSHLGDAPRDVKWSILLEVPPSNLPSFCAVNREFAELCRNPAFRTAYKAKWPGGSFFLGEKFSIAGVGTSGSAMSRVGNRIDMTLPTPRGVLYVKYRRIDKRSAPSVGEEAHVRFTLQPGTAHYIHLSRYHPSMDDDDLKETDLLAELRRRGITSGMTFDQILDHITKALRVAYPEKPRWLATILA